MPGPTPHTPPRHRPDLGDNVVAPDWSRSSSKGGAHEMTDRLEELRRQLVGGSIPPPGQAERSPVPIREVPAAGLEPVPTTQRAPAPVDERALAEAGAQAQRLLVEAREEAQAHVAAAVRYREQVEYEVDLMRTAVVSELEHRVAEARQECDAMLSRASRDARIVRQQAQEVGFGLRREVLDQVTRAQSQLQSLRHQLLEVASCLATPPPDGDWRRPPMLATASPSTDAAPGPRPLPGPPPARAPEPPVREPPAPEPPAAEPPAAEPPAAEPQAFAPGVHETGVPEQLPAAPAPAGEVPGTPPDEVSGDAATVIGSRGRSLANPTGVAAVARPGDPAVGRVPYWARLVRLLDRR